MTEEEAQYMIAKLKRAGKYSTKYTKPEKSEECDRCVKPRTPHSAETCFFKDKECHACKVKGHMKGAKRCNKNKSVRKLEIVVSDPDEEENDYDDKTNWKSEEKEERREDTHVEIRKVEERVPEEANDYNDKSNWGSEEIEEGCTITEIEIRKVEEKKKNIVRVKVGEVETDMYADSGADVSTVASSWYRKGMGTLVPTTDVLKPYGSTEALPVEAKFKTTITTAKGAKEETWVYVVNSKCNILPLLGDDVATALGFLNFKPEGRNPCLLYTSPSPRDS